MVGRYDGSACEGGGRDDAGDSALPPPHPEERVASDSIARNTVYATVNGVVSAAIAAVLTLYLIRALDPHGYGVYTLALAVGALFALVMDLGISSSALASSPSGAATGARSPTTSLTHCG